MYMIKYANFVLITLLTF